MSLTNDCASRLKPGTLSSTATKVAWLSRRLKPYFVTSKVIRSKFSLFRQRFCLFLHELIANSE